MSGLVRCWHGKRFAWRETRIQYSQPTVRPSIHIHTIKEYSINSHTPSSLSTSSSIFATCTLWPGKHMPTEGQTDGLIAWRTYVQPSSIHPSSKDDERPKEPDILLICSIQSIRVVDTATMYEVLESEWYIVIDWPYRRSVWMTDQLTDVSTNLTTGGNGSGDQHKLFFYLIIKMLYLKIVFFFS